MSLIGEVAGGHHEGEEEDAVVAVGGVVAAGDHRREVAADAQVVRQVGRCNRGKGAPLDTESFSVFILQ